MEEESYLYDIATRARAIDAIARTIFDDDSVFRMIHLLVADIQKQLEARQEAAALLRGLQTRR